MSLGGREKLLAAAEANKGDIGTACAILKKLAPDSPSPGDLITWIAKMRPDKMKDHVDRLAALRPEFEKIDNTHVRRLYDPHDQGWTGTSGSAFEDRWCNDFLTYVGTDGTSGRRGAFKDSEDMLNSVVLVTDKLQERTAGYIEANLNGLYQKLVEAVKDDSEKVANMQAETLATAEVAGIILAVSATGPIMAAAGALGIVVASIFGFMKATVEDAQKSVGAAVAGSAMSLPDIQEKLTSFLPADEAPYAPGEAAPGDEYDEPGFP